MKKLFSIFLSGLAIASTTLSFQSCADEYDPAIVTKHDQKQLAYNDAFLKTFGEPAANHDWGFKPQPVINTNAATRTTNTEMNQWVSTYHLDVPGGIKTDQEHSETGDPWTYGDVTDAEREYVYWWFSTHKSPTPININWSDYFIQNVWGQPEHRGQYGMDQCTPIFADGTHDQHVSNFNSGGYATEQIEYQWESTTNAFGFISSYSTGDAHFCNNYTLQYINGNYYLAFDYEHHKLDAEPADHLMPDHYYNDWILKLWGGYHQADKYTQRVMCEDLGGSFDFDFNDVVFDVTFINNKADITLQAAGGTLPLYIGEVNDAYEVHRLFGVPTDTPVNVSVNGDIRPAVKFSIELNDNNYDSSFNDNIDGQIFKNAKGIKVFVGDNNGKAHEVCQFREKGDHSGNNVPDKICCPTTTKWMKELQHISDGYPDFKEYVSNPSIEWYSREGSNLFPNNGVGQNEARPYKPSIYADEHEGNIGFTPWETLVANEVNWSELEGTLEQSEFEGQCPSRNDYVADNTLLNSKKVVTVSCSEGGSVKINGESVESKEIEPNTSVTITAIPNDGFRFVKWVETYNEQNTVSENANYSFTPENNVNYKAIFEEDQQIDNTAYFSVSGNTITIQASNCQLSNYNGGKALLINKSYFENMNDFSSVVITLVYDSEVQQIGGGVQGNQFGGSFGNNPTTLENGDKQVTCTISTTYNGNLKDNIKDGDTYISFHTGGLPKTITITCQ
ncbi:MAG: hypothetical protein KBT15_04200 [Bacteroidales bacterium]|nr:hypothetical protein [Candidatus Minthousia equi]